MKYNNYIREAVKSWWEENNSGFITDYEIDELPKEEVLRMFLEWEGIIGYTGYIINIMNQDD